MNIESLRQKFDQGEHLKYLFFWGHQPQEDGSISAACLSQWWPQEFVVENKVFKTAEHWMMYQKAKLFNDLEVADKMLKVKSPGEVKKLGRMVSSFNLDQWNQHKLNIVIKGNLAKFSQNPDLADFLLKTKSRVLVEASPVDFIWGIGMAKDHPDIYNPHAWRGENLLGFALMEVRKILSEKISVKNLKSKRNEHES